VHVTILSNIGPSATVETDDLPSKIERCCIDDHLAGSRSAAAARCDYLPTLPPEFTQPTDSRTACSHPESQGLASAIAVAAILVSVRRLNSVTLVRLHGEVAAGEAGGDLPKPLSEFGVVAGCASGVVNFGVAAEVA
jgi:hypothetical protein